MKLIIIAAALISLCSAEKCSGILENKEICCDVLGCFNKNIPFKSLPLPCCPGSSDVQFLLFTRNNRHDAVPITIIQQLPSEFVRGERVVFIIHGWKGSSANDWVIEMKDALLAKNNWNVILVNWSGPAGWLRYPQSASNTRTTGALTAAISRNIVSEEGTSWDDIWCVGHSLGAHVCGHAGMRTAGKMGRITGLDPAGPSFEGESNLEIGLNPKSAKFVDVLHTDAKGSINSYGSVRPLGHMDFYPNGLGRQPGCSGRRQRRDIDTTGEIGCSHGRAQRYFIESITHGDCFVSRQKCHDHLNMPGSCTSCDGDACAVMGYGSDGSGNDGIYYLQTKSSNYPPHCLG